MVYSLCRRFYHIHNFERNRHLRKRTTYLIINLTIDLFVVSGPMHIYHNMTAWGNFVVLVNNALVVNVRFSSL